MAIFERKQSFSKPSPIQKPSSIFRSSPIQRPIAKKPSPQKPKTLFEEKKDWTRSEFIRKTSQAPLGYKGRYEREKMLKETLPVGKFGTYISESEAKAKLREMREKEYYAKGKEKEELGKMRKYLEKGTGLKGKY